MNYRGAELYVQPKTKKRLRMIARALGEPGDNGNAITADQLGDQYLNELIESRYPQIKDLEQEQEAAEKSFMQSLKV